MRGRYRMKTEAETGLRQPQAKMDGHHPEVRKGPEDSTQTQSLRGRALLTTLIPSWNHETINFCSVIQFVLLCDGHPRKRIQARSLLRPSLIPIPSLYQVRFFGLALGPFPHHPPWTNISPTISSTLFLNFNLHGLSLLQVLLPIVPLKYPFTLPSMFISAFPINS